MSKLLLICTGCLRARRHLASAVLLLFCFMIPMNIQAAEQQDQRLVSLAADVAAGTDIAVVIKNAVDSGLTLRRATEEIVTTSVDPGRVAYLGILAKYLPPEVICGVANAVTKMKLPPDAFLEQIALVASTSLQAGASESEVRTGLACGGIAATEIGNAIVRATQSPAPVFGYTTPTQTTPPTAGIGAPTRTMGGGGARNIGTTTPASPTQGQQR
jgi:hypothetical protein